MAWQTHTIQNQIDELTNHNLYAGDVALQAAVQRHGGQQEVALHALGAELGSLENYGLAEQANRHQPQFQGFDARGRRIDLVEFHPAWHHWEDLARQQGLHSSPFAQGHPGRWVEWAARFYMHAQLEPGSLCPISMTLGAIPLLQREPALWAEYGAKILSTAYDERDLPSAHKRSLSVGMGMTEKQGGSDVRSNQTQALPVGPGGRGGEYELRGHKWFFSAPMCDAHLVVAQTPVDGLACFFVPRWRPDGRKNSVQIQRLKAKVGNRSNASSEVEFNDAYGVMMGEPGRGIPTIIEMATYTRLTCSLSSAGLMRQALVQALAYARQRRAFGRTLAEQPLMQGVLVDLVLEAEAALTLSMQLAAAFESEQPWARSWRRLMTPAAKFWLCKRAVELTGEAMEVFGGNGYVDDSVVARLFREAPVNSIWEGSGNVMCLDVVRAIARDPQSAFELLDQFDLAATGQARLVAEVAALRQMLLGPVDRLEAQGRLFTGRLVVLSQACLLRQQAPSCVFEGFMATRYDPNWGRVVGLLDASLLDVGSLLERGLPA